MTLLVALALSAVSPSLPYERPVTPAGPGPNSLDVDATLVTHAAPGAALRDLRLQDADGREVPYLLVGPPSKEPSWLPAKPVPLHATRDQSGFEADLGEVVTGVRRLRLSGLRAPFLKRVRLEGSGDRRRWVSLVEEGTLFDLPGDGLRQLELTFPAGDFRYLRATFDDHASGRVGLPESVTAQTVGHTASPAMLAIDVRFERRAGEPGKSRFHLLLPAAKLPLVALRLAAGGTHLSRDAEVSEPILREGEVVQQPLGRATLRRTVQGDVSAVDLRIPLAAPNGVDLDLVVDDGDNPPIELTSVQGEIGPLPHIYFEARDARPLTAHFGASDVEAPRYDLEAMRAAVEGRQPPRATWGALQTVAAANASPEPALDPAALVGATIDASAFQTARPIGGGPSGLNAVLLDAKVLAHGDLADLRIADAQGRQIPYLVERRNEPLIVPVTIGAVAQPAVAMDRGVTAYPLTLPEPALPAGRLVLATPSRLFEREVRVALERPAAEREPATLRVLASEHWAHGDAEGPSAPLTLSLPVLDGGKLWLLIADGDNRRLPVSSAELLLPADRLRFFRQGEGQLKLLYGAALAAPRYDLELLAPRLVGVAATEVSLGAPEAAGASSEAGGMDLQRGMFWGALAIAVLVLLGVMAWLLTRAKIEPE